MPRVTVAFKGKPVGVDGGIAFPEQGGELGGYWKDAAVAIDNRTHAMKPASGLRIGLRTLHAPVLATFLVVALTVMPGAWSTAADGSLAQVGAASRAVVECQGAPATFVGSPGQPRLVGTDGDDVIVTGGALAVEARAGADLVCVTGRTTEVDAGEGDDSVTTSDDVTTTFTSLGAGANSFAGGSRPDRVESGAEVDRVATGAGDDEYIGYATLADIVDLGPGSDVARLDSPNLAGVLDGGPGLNTLDLETRDSRSSTTIMVDNTSETAAIDGEARFQWDRFWAFTFFYKGQLTFLGSPASERLKVVVWASLGTGPRIQSLSMLGGDDVVTLNRALGDIDGGAGVDSLRLLDFTEEYTGELDVGMEADLSAGAVRWRGPEAALVEVENLVVDGFLSAVVRGDEQANRLIVRRACFARLHGGRGADVIRAWPLPDCPEWAELPRSIHARGQRGADELVGRSTRDRLFGGPGIDVADGRAGIDVCDAEQRSRCERAG